MRRVVLSIVIFAALGGSSEAHADRWRGFPTIGGGVVLGTEETHGHLWVGAIFDRPTARQSGRFVGAALELDFHGEVATVGGTIRVGTMAFPNRKSELHWFSGYGLFGAAAQLIEDEVVYVARVGVGISIPPMLALLRAGLAIPTTFELVIDAGDRGSAVQARLCWGF